MSIYFPDSLYEIAGNAVNKLPEPISWSWSVSNVMEWVEYGLKLSQYIVIFKENNIDGKKLIFVNCQTLPSMGINDFDHMKLIAKSARRLYGLPPDTERVRLDPSGLTASIHEVYGRYYKHLAASLRCRTSLFDYMRSVGLVVDRRGTSDVVRLARLSAVEHLRGGQNTRADRAVVRISLPVTQVRLARSLREIPAADGCE